MIDMINDKQKATPIPDAFIDDYLPDAENPTYVLVYILAYRYYSVGLELSVKEAAFKLGITENDVTDAWHYWARNGIVTVTDSPEDGFCVEMLEVHKKKAKRKKAEVKEKKEPEPQPDSGQIGLANEKKADYSPMEIEAIASKDKQLMYLFKLTERLLAKPLTHGEMTMITWFYDWLKLPAEVIEVLLDYCISNNKGMRYIEKVAIDWENNGFTTAQEAEAHLKMINNEYRDIMKAFGHTRRDPNPKEMAYMRKWLKELGMPAELVKEACEKTVLSIGQPKFTYADAIIVSWHEAEVRTLDEVKALDDNFYKNMGERNKETERNARKQTKAVSRGTKFNNFEGRKRDYDRIFEMEQKLITQSLDNKDNNGGGGGDEVY
jgi:DnaD/phage-associated family protein